jgi:hypothetical protein
LQLYNRRLKYKINLKLSVDVEQQVLIDPPTLRLLWRIVEETRSCDLLSLSDPDLVVCLLSLILGRKVLSAEEISIVHEYIHSKLSLIRDLAEMNAA